MKQITIFDKVIRVDDLKKGKQCCDGCGKLMRAYAKTLDKRLLYLGYEILEHLNGRKSKYFNPRGVFGEDHHKLNDFQKLGYWKIIERTNKNGVWKLTYNGYRFLIGGRQLPKRVWVFNKQAIDWDDELLYVKQLDDRWQEERQDWSYDYIPYKLNA